MAEILPDDDEAKTWRELAENTIADMRNYADDELASRRWVSVHAAEERFALLDRALASSPTAAACPFMLSDCNLTEADLCPTCGMDADRKGGPCVADRTAADIDKDAEIARLTDVVRSIAETQWDSGAADACVAMIRSDARAAIAKSECAQCHGKGEIYFGGTVPDPDLRECTACGGTGLTRARSYSREGLNR